MKILVFDIETIPDTSVLEQLRDEQDLHLLNIQERRERLRAYHLEKTKGANDFTRQLFHQVVTIALLRLDEESGTLEEFRSLGTESSSEKELLEEFWEHFNMALRPRLVTFNGRGFDIPVLKYRSLFHRMKAPSEIFSKNYNYRYDTHYNYDLLELLSDFGSSSRVSLAELCALLRIPSKLSLDGAGVSSAYDQGRLDEIRQYCQTDVASTYLIYLRYQRLRGELSEDSFKKALRLFIDQLIAKKDEKAIGEYLSRWAELDSQMAPYLSQGTTG